MKLEPSWLLLLTPATSEIRGCSESWPFLTGLGSISAVPILVLLHVVHDAPWHCLGKGVVGSPALWKTA